MTAARTAAQTRILAEVRAAGTTWTAPRRSVRTYRDSYGREVYADTGRVVDEDFGSHVVLWIVHDPEAWAAHLEAEGDAELVRWPKKDRGIAEHRRAERYESAARVRGEGPVRDWRVGTHTAASAEACVADLRRVPPNPGVRYETAPITGVGACPDCKWPLVEADGVRRHAGGRWDADCNGRRPTDAPAAPTTEEDERQSGEFEITVPRGPMVCGYCDGTEEMWPAADPGAHMSLVLGYSRLTGYHALGVGPAGELVVLAEATTHRGAVVWLPHLCGQIPDAVREKYADQIEAMTNRRNP